MGLKKRLSVIKDTVLRASESVGRDPGSVTLVVVSKTVPLDLMLEAYDLGVRHFGESRWQEAEPKLRSMPDDVVWHFVGKLQSNKAKRVAGAFDVLHTIESSSQVREADKAAREVQALVEVNVAREPQKSGIFVENLDSMVKVLSSSVHVRFRGLMAIGPVVSDPELSRNWFRQLADLGKRVGAEWLSMGMSADYDVAIQEGATHVRVGSALFGERD